MRLANHWYAHSKVEISEGLGGGSRHEEYKVETILNNCKLQSRDTEYLVKWRGYHVKEAT